jgi:hypothetical protein
MKITFAILIGLLFAIPIFAQNDSLELTSLHKDHSIDYPQLKKFLTAEKNNYGSLIGMNKPWHSTRFRAVHQQLHPTDKLVTFMDGPMIFSSTTVEISSNSSPHFQRYQLQNSTVSPVLELLGIAGSVIAGIKYPSYIGSINHNSGAVIGAYLQSTNHH